MCASEETKEKMSLLAPSASDDDQYEDALMQHNYDSDSNSTEKAPPATAWSEAIQLINLTIPTVLIQLGFTVPPFFVASHVGRHYGYLYLDGLTLANLIGNLFVLALLQGLYSASDTLSPQAFGAGNPRQVGLLAMRGLFGSLMVIIPANILLVLYMKQLLQAAGQDEEAAAIACAWYRIYALAMPFYALYMVTWKFLSAQNIMMPLVVVVVLNCAIVLPVTLLVFPARYGFLGTAWAIVVFQVIEATSLIVLLWWKQPYIAETWPGLGAWREAMELKPFLEYMTLGVGGMLACSEWIYWETLALVIGTLGVVPLSVHTIPTQVIMVMFMIPLGVGIALSVRLGILLTQSVRRAKQLVVGCFVFGVVVFGIMTVILYTARYSIFGIFTDDPRVLEGADQIWSRVCLYYFNLAIFGINMGVATGLGMQWTLAFVTILFLWVIGMPAAWFFATVRGGGLVVAWSWIVPPYMAINAALFLAYVNKNWDQIAADIRLRESRESVVRSDSDIEGLLLEETHDHGGNSGYGSTASVDVDVAVAVIS